MKIFLLYMLYLLLLAPPTLAVCAPSSPAYPLPDYSKHQPILLDALQKIQNEVESIVADQPYDTTAFSIEVTSSKQTLWSSFHTARDRDLSRPGADEVNGDSVYRIASVTKIFTVQGILQQHAAGHLHLDDTVDTYLTELRGPQSGSIRWKDITLRSLASQLSGLPLDWPKGSNSTRFPDPTKLGLPPLNNSASLPRCSVYDDHRPCSEADLITAVKTLKPLFAPNAKSTYSNVAFELLGLVLSKVTDMSYEEYIASSILGPIGMNATTFVPPADSVAVLPKNESWYFSIDQGIQKPTGRLYSTSSDLSIYLRYVLTYYNDLHTDSNWLQPASFSTGSSSYYGMPWEIYRPPVIPRVTFFTKGGGVPGYTSIVALAPEYDLGITILVGGNAALLPRLLEVVAGVPLVEAAEEVAGLELSAQYNGTYTAGSKLNSTLTLAYTTQDKALYVDRWISNGTDFLAVLLQTFPGVVDDHNTRLQLVPTMLYVNEEKQRGERWRALPVQIDQPQKRAVWDDFCITNMYGVTYDGLPLNEFVFWNGEVDVTALRVKLTKVTAVEDGHKEGREGLVVQ